MGVYDPVVKCVVKVVVSCHLLNSHRVLGQVSLRIVPELRHQIVRRAQLVVLPVVELLQGGDLPLLLLELPDGVVDRAREIVSTPQDLDSRRP